MLHLILAVVLTCPCASKGHTVINRPAVERRVVRPDTIYVQQVPCPPTRIIERDVPAFHDVDRSGRSFWCNHPWVAPIIGVAAGMVIEHQLDHDRPATRIVTFGLCGRRHGGCRK